MDAITLPLPGRRRRSYSREFKAQIVETCLRPGTSVAAIARQHNINDNVVHRWIREAEQASLSVVSGASLPAGIEANAISTCATPACLCASPGQSRLAGAHPAGADQK